MRRHSPRPGRLASGNHAWKCPSILAFLSARDSQILFFNQILFSTWINGEVLSEWGTFSDSERNNLSGAQPCLQCQSKLRLAMLVDCDGPRSDGQIQALMPFRFLRRLLRGLL